MPPFGTTTRSICAVGLGEILGERGDIGGIDLGSLCSHFSHNVSPLVFGILCDLDSFQRVACSAYAFNNPFGCRIPGRGIAAADIEYRALGACSGEGFGIRAEFTRSEERRVGKGCES